MAFSVGSLADYTRQNADNLIIASHFDAKTQQLILSEGNVLSKIKSSDALPLIATDAFFQSDSTCGFVASGTTTITQRVLTVGKIKVQQQFCEKDLEAKFTQQALKAGSSNTGIPFEQKITEEIAMTIAEQLETAIWQGDLVSANANLNKFDGLLKILNAASGTVIQANASGFLGIPKVTGAVTTTNAKAIADAMWVALPAKLQGKDDVRIMCGYDFYNTFLLAFRDQNLFNFAPTRGEAAPNGEVIIPGTNYRLTAVHGLDGTNRLVAARMSNLFLGTDVQGEEDKFEMWYSQDDRVEKLHVAFKMGVQVAYVNEIVNFII
jgi:hypothetical protein